MLVPNALSGYIGGMNPRREYHQEWYRRNKERVVATGRAWSKENRERRNAISRAWRARNREQMAAISKAYQEAHRETRLAAAREYKRRTYEQRVAHEKAYYEKHPEKLVAKQRAYRQRHPEKATRDGAMRRLRKEAGAIVKFTAAQLRARLSMYGGKCWMCGKPGKQVDHVIPLARGGAHVLANLRPACGPCNRKKGAKLLHK